jgi:hypothetical protein
MMTLKMSKMKQGKTGKCQKLKNRQNGKKTITPNYTNNFGQITNSQK